MMTVLHKNASTVWVLTFKFGGGDSSKTTAIGKTKDGTNVNATGANVANGEAVNAESGVQNVSDVIRLTDFIRSDFGYY